MKRLKLFLFWLLIIALSFNFILPNNAQALTLEETLERLNYAKTWDKHALIWSEAVIRGLAGRLGSRFLTWFMPITGFLKPPIEEWEVISPSVARGWGVFVTATILNRLGPWGNIRWYFASRGIRLLQKLDKMVISS